MGTSAAVKRWAPLIVSISKLHDVDPYLIGGIIAQESGGPYALKDGSANPYAIRVEKGFWSRYKDGIMRWVNGSSSTSDNRWVAYPDIYSCSYGLGQIMLQTAYENGFDGIFPTELCDPEINIDILCRMIAKNIKQTGDVSKALLRYNGGGNLEYPAHVLAHRLELVDGRVFE